MARRTMTLRGRRLVVEGLPLRAMTIHPDATLADAVSISMEAREEAELDAIDFEEGRDALLRVKPREAVRARGWLANLFARTPGVDGDLVAGSTRRPTLRVEIGVPPGFPLRLAVSSGSTSIGDVDGDLHVDAAGACGIEAASCADLRVEIAGAGRVAAGRVSGRIDAGISGAGRLSVGQVSGGGMRVRTSGAANVAVSQGSLASLDADMSGNGAIDVQAPVSGDASVRISGAGRIALTSVAGTLDQAISGSSKVELKQ